MISKKYKTRQDTKKEKKRMKKFAKTKQCKQQQKIFLKKGEKIRRVSSIN